jgi:hypothetical protein
LKKPRPTRKPVLSALLSLATWLTLWPTCVDRT